MITPELRHKIDSLGGVRCLSENFLIDNQLKRVVGPRGALLLFSEKDYEERLGKARTLLENYSGYIPDQDHYNLAQLVDGNSAAIGELDLQGIESAAVVLKNAGYRIYQPDRLVVITNSHEGVVRRSCFPVIDLFIQFCIGMKVGNKNKHLFAKDPVSDHLGYKIVPTPLGWIDIFLKTAFTRERKIDPQLINEWLYFITLHLRSKNDKELASICQNDRLRIEALEVALADKSHAPAYKSVNGVDAREVVRFYTWYLDFSPPDREKIVEAYLAAYNSRTKDSPQTAAVYHRITKTFTSAYEAFKFGVAPVLAQEAAQRELAQLELMVQNALATKTVDSLPLEAFEGSVWQKFGDSIKDLFRSVFYMVPPNQIFGGYQILASKINVRVGILRLDVLRDVLLDELCVKLVELSDRQFIELFVSKTGGGLSHRAHQNFRVDTANDERTNKFRQILQERFANLPAQVKRKKK